MGCIHNLLFLIILIFNTELPSTRKRRRISMDDTVFEKDLDLAVDKLINYANDSGGKDNITVAIVAN